MGPNFFPLPSLPANNFLVLLMYGLLMTKVLVLTALLMFLAGRALASWAWAGLGPVEHGEASLLAERGHR